MKYLRSVHRGLRRHLLGGTDRPDGGVNGAPWVISGLGIVLAGLSLWYLVVYRALRLRLDLGTYPDLLLGGIEVVLLGSFSVVLVYAGYWLATSTFDRRKRWWAGLWTVLGLTGLVTLVTLVQSSQILGGQPVDPPSILQELLFAAGVGGFAGLLIGISTVRATQNRERVTRQRDSLEFMNALLRHNVLNGMQLVLANVDLLHEELEAGTIDRDRAIERLGTVETRGREMVELVENIRVLTRSVSGEAGTRAVAISDVLREEVECARCRYDGTFEADVPDGVRVRADELLGTVIETVLRHVVEHSETEQPDVRVALGIDGDRVRVTVSDGGSGVPVALERLCAEHGERDARERDAPAVGPGFELHLVSALVARYGGDVRIEDEDGDPTRFCLEFRRA